MAGSTKRGRRQLLGGLAWRCCPRPGRRASETIALVLMVIDGQFGIPSALRILHTEPPEKIVRAAWLRACLHSFVDQVNVGIRWMMFRKSICRCSVATNAKPLREIMRKNGMRYSKQRHHPLGGGMVSRLARRCGPPGRGLFRHWLRGAGGRTIPSARWGRRVDGVVGLGFGGESLNRELCRR